MRRRGGAISTARHRPRRLRRPESGRLIDRMFGGRVTPLVAQLAERDRLTDADIAEIEALLKALRS